MPNQKDFASLSDSEREHFDLVLHAAIHNLECPSRIGLNTLAEKKFLRVETFAIWNGTGRNGRVATILTDAHNGKQTLKPKWIRDGQMPIKIQDGRSTEELRELKLPINADLVRKAGKTKPSIEMPDWETWKKD